MLRPPPDSSTKLFILQISSQVRGALCAVAVHPLRPADAFATDAHPSTEEQLPR